jgi:hypothetical protein
MLISIGDLLVMLSRAGILGCRRCWRWHLFVIQKSFAFFQIMSIGADDTSIFTRIRGPLNIKDQALEI